MTKLYITDNVHTTTVADVVYTVTVASAASDTTVTTSGSGTSLINTSAGGIHTLNSLTAGSNVTIVDDDAGNLTIAATEDDISNNDTDDLSEGSTNLYYTDTRVDTALTTVGGNILPASDNTQYLGSTAKRWHSLYLGPGTLYIDDHPILSSSDDDTINFSTDTGQTMDFFAGGASGTDGVINMTSRGNITSLRDTTVNLGPVSNGATINARGDLTVHGTLDIDTADIGGFTVAGVKIENTGNIELETASPGYIHAITDDLYIGPIAGAVKIDEGSITTTAGNLTIGAFGTVDVAGHNTTAETATLIATAKAEAIASAESKDVARMVTSDAYADASEAAAIASAESKDGVRATAANAYADAAVAVLTSGASATHDTLLEIQNLMATDAELSSAISGLNHDSLAGFVANEHIDWTTDQGSTNIHAGNYTDTNTVYTDAEAISAVEGESTLDLTGTVTIGDLEFTNYTQWGEEFGKLKATGTNQNLCLEASDGTGYFLVKSPNIYFGAASGVKVTNAASSDTTLSGFGYSGEGLNITGDLTGDVTGDVTGDLTGNLTADATTEKLTTKNIISNADSVTIPNVSNWGGFPMFANTGGVSSATKDSGQTGGGYPFIGVTQSNSSATQPPAQYLINNMNYDISGGTSGHGVKVIFAAQDESGKLLDIATNLCKIRESTVSGSAGSSTVDSWKGEYTLSITDNDGSSTATTNAITTNTDFTQVKKELRVCDVPADSGSIYLSGLYLTYDGAETGTPTAKIQLRNNGTSTTTSLIELTEAKVDFKKVVKLASNTTTEQNALTGVAGDMLFNSTTSKFMGHNGSAWVELG